MSMVLKMKKSKDYYYNLDIIRILSCLGVLFYHLGLLKGGFLSVCSFFVLSGYLSYTSLSSKNKVSLKDYYIKRFQHIYLPLLIVVLITVGITYFIPVIHWFNLKVETTSVLFGYNNFWQLSVNADYFARHINSPFMHFWYIGILLQIDIVFPVFFLGIKKIKERTKKVVPLLLISLLIVGSLSYFLYFSINHQLMNSYYHTLARVYSYLFGVLCSYITLEWKNPIIRFKKILSKIVFYEYLMIFIFLNFVVESNSSFYAIAMIGVTLLTGRMIHYGTIKKTNKLNLFQKIIHSFADVSYEVYLLQYPVLFFFQYLNIPSPWNIICIIIVIIVLSYIIHFALSYSNKKQFVFKIILCGLFGICTLFGGYVYISSKDYSKEINDLKAQLAENQELLKKKQEEYKNRLKEENDSWNSVLSDLESGEAELGSYVTNLPVVGVGDSVMLGAVPSLYNTFPNGYFDAKVSRTDYEANGILLGVKNQGLLSNDIVIHLGTNGQCGRSCQNEILSTCENRNVYWVTVSNDYDVHVNSGLYSLAEDYSNVSIIDWFSISQGHGEYFAPDGIHLTGEGTRVYSEAIYKAIYDHYYNEYQKKKETIMREHEQEQKRKVSFYGNDALLNNTTALQNEFTDSSFMIKEDYTPDKLLKDIKKDKEDGSLNYNVVILMDTINNTSLEDYQRIIEVDSTHQYYFLFLYHQPYTFKEDNVSTINFYKEAQKNNDYFTIDQIHLSEKGCSKLIHLIQDNLEIQKETTQ